MGDESDASKLRHGCKTVMINETSCLESTPVFNEEEAPENIDDALRIHASAEYMREMSQAANIVATPFKGLARPTIAAHRTRTVCPVRAVVDSSQEAFAVDVIEGSSSTPVLVDFHAAWCGPCKLVAPSMVWADKEYDGKLKVVKIDCTDGNKDLMEQYRVYGLPCLLTFKDGELVAGSLREGAITKKGLAEYIEQWTGLSAAV